jgi:hypothetical protein
MQDRYVGDIGDYVKLAILRALSPGRRLGIAWWLFPDSGSVGDGRHISYLGAPTKWRHLDPQLYDALEHVVASGSRKIAALEDANLLPGSIYFSEVIPTGATPYETRKRREGWFARCQAQLTGCDLVFLDPDNGLEPKAFSLGAKKGGKSVSLAALETLRQPGRTLVVYHHHTRRAEGHVAELSYWADRLRARGFDRVDALRASPYSPRAFFLLNADDEMRDRAAALGKQWGNLISWYGDCVHPRWTWEAGDIEVFPGKFITEDLTTEAQRKTNAEHDAILKKAREDAAKEEDQSANPDDTGNPAQERLTELGIFIAGEDVIHDGEAGALSVTPMTKVPLPADWSQRV